jgi:hypothetical protein
MHARLIRPFVGHSWHHRDGVKAGSAVRGYVGARVFLVLGLLSPLLLGIKQEGGSWLGRQVIT